MKFATADIPPCRGEFKSALEDFRVSEVPLYEFAGEGDHTLVLIEKAGISTFEAIRRTCRAVGFNERDVGYAGMKDAHGVTRQWLSFEHTDPEKFLTLSLPKVRVLEVTKHGNKLKRGHLAGNRFEVVLRGVNESDVPHAEAALQVLSRHGVPNWYDTQRFGRRGDNAVLGLALVRGRLDEYFELMLGGSDHERDPAVRAARQAFEDGELDGALKLWPSRDNFERKALHAIKDYGPTWKALKKLPQKVKQLQVSAVQSLLFNRVLERRFDDYDKVWEGDLAQKANGAYFAVEDEQAEQSRAESFEISPTGPVFGHKMRTPAGRAAVLEEGVLHEERLTREDFDIGQGLSQKGDRRPLRFPVGEVGTSFLDGALTLKFFLPKGCYATVLLREITKTDEDLAFSGDGK